jgi:hypothetical protein
MTKQAVARLHEAGIICVGGCITGFPHDDVADVRENFEFFDSLGIDHIFDQIITPYPKTGSREVALQGGYVTNLDDLRWYNGYWANVRTDHLSSEQLLWWRWKLKREVIGPFRADPIYLRHYPVFGRIWKYVVRPLYLAFDAIYVKAKGEKARYDAQIAAHRRKDVNNLEPPPEPFRALPKPPKPKVFNLRGRQGRGALDPARLPLVQ